MTETTPPKAPTRGPFLQLACLCENVITDTEGALSLIRVVDQLTQSAQALEPPEQMPPFMLSTLKLVITLKPGEARGRYAIKLRPEDPSGSQLPTLETPIHLEGENRGVNIVMGLQFAIQMEGLYWFDVLFSGGQGQEDVLLTRIPLQIIYQPQRLAPS